MRKIALLLMLAASLAATGLDENTVTVTASRPSNVQPDQVLLYVYFTASADMGLDDILAALKPAGITAANLSGVSQVLPAVTGRPGAVATTTAWTFLLPVAFSAMKDALTTLTQLQSTLRTPEGLPALTFSVAGVRTSAAAQAAQACPLSALVGDARKQGDAMASAAGMRTGPIVSVSDGSSADGLVPAAVFGVLTGDFSQSISGGVVSNPFLGGISASSLQPSCTLTVQFQLMP